MLFIYYLSDARKTTKRKAPPVILILQPPVMLIIVNIQHLHHTLTHHILQRRVSKLAVRQDKGKDAVSRERALTFSFSSLLCSLLILFVTLREVKKCRVVAMYLFDQFAKKLTIPIASATGIEATSSFVLSMS